MLLSMSGKKKAKMIEGILLGGSGGAFPIRKTKGVTAVDINPRTSI